MSKETNVVVGGSCVVGLFYLAWVGFLWFLSTWAFQYSIMVWFGKDLPTWVDWVAGLLLSEVMPLVWIVSLIADCVADKTPIF